VLLKHAIAEWGKQSAPMANYVVNRMGQERAADKAAAVQL
jgi:hypothetical protein